MTRRNARGSTTRSSLSRGAVILRGGVIALFVLCSAGVVALGVGRSTPSASSTVTTTTVATNAPFYLVMGGSSSLGLQPDGVPSDNAELTENGYANDVVKLEKDQLHQILNLDQIGCLGTRVEYLTTDPVSNTCYTAPTTQLTAAVAFLTAHEDDTGIVSIDLGFKNGAAAFNSSDTSRITLGNVGTIPANVEAVCTYTWMCVGSPFGPDDHPNNAGYWLLARAIVAALPPPWRITTVK
jgi:hypothetical protein